MEINEAIEKILTGNCVLFTGSGFSFGTKNITGSMPLSADSLTTLLYKECSIDDGDSDLKSASDFYLESHGEHKLIELLRTQFTISDVSTEHSTITSVPWKRIYTTNYDNSCELCYSKQSRLLTPITLNEKIDHYKDKRTICVHLNGYIERLTPASLYKDFKLTNTSYLTTEFVNSNWVDLFRNDIESSSVILFVGFSCNSDLDLARVISASKRRKNIFFIVKPKESLINIKKLEKFGTPLDIGLQGLADMIEGRRKTFEVPEFLPVEPRSFNKVEVNDTPIAIKDIDILDLLFKGDVNERILHYSLVDFGKYPYYIKRNETDEVIEYVTKGGRSVLVHSDLGNGKTLFLQGVADRLVTIGYDVYFFNKYYGQTYQEIEQLCSSKRKTVLIFENYSSHFDLLKRLSLHRTQDVVVIVSERTTINDTVYFTLEETIFSDGYLTKDLNRLSTEEVALFSELLTKYGLWGKHASLSAERKRQLIVSDCHASFRLTLLLLFSSPDIKGRFSNLLDSIRDANESFFSATLLILASNIFDFNLSLDDLIYILDDDLLNNPAFNNNDRLMEMINFDEYKIKARSSILSQALLINSQYNDELVSVLIQVIKKLDTRRYDKNNFHIIKSIVSFSRLQGIFNLSENPKFKPIILNFFEEIKNTGFAHKNPFFWLQYAIARLSTRDYTISDTYFQTAYSLATSNPDFDTFQIDNHYSRHLLENEVYNGVPETCMEQFLKAHQILTNKGDFNKNRHYPLRVAINYGKFYDRFFGKISEQDKRVFVISCKEMLLKVNEYKTTVEETRWNKSVTICESELNRIVIKEGSYE